MTYLWNNFPPFLFFCFALNSLQLNRLLFCVTPLLSSAVRQYGLFLTYLRSRWYATGLVTELISTVQFVLCKLIASISNDEKLKFLNSKRHEQLQLCLLLLPSLNLGNKLTVSNNDTRGHELLFCICYIRKKAVPSSSGTLFIHSIAPLSHSQTFTRSLFGRKTAFTWQVNIFLLSLFAVLMSA